MNKSIGQMIEEVREVNTALGWRAEEKTLGDFVALLHTEVGETTEAYRDHRLADATQQRLHGIDTRTGGPVKPEGVGSELADVVVRLADACDVLGFHLWDRDNELGDVPPFGASIVQHFNIRTFGDWMAWMHRHIVQFQDSLDGSRLLRAVVTVADEFGIDLTFEYERKIAYNRTRPYQHGGRTLSEARP